MYTVNRERQQMDLGSREEATTFTQAKANLIWNSKELIFHSIFQVNLGLCLLPYGNIVNNWNGYEAQHLSLLYVFVIPFGLDPAQGTIGFVKMLEELINRNISVKYATRSVSFQPVSAVEYPSLDQAFPIDLH